MPQDKHEGTRPHPVLFLFVPPNKVLIEWLGLTIYSPHTTYRPPLLTHPQKSAFLRTPYLVELASLIYPASQNITLPLYHMPPAILKLPSNLPTRPPGIPVSKQCSKLPYRTPRIQPESTTREKAPER